MSYTLKFKTKKKTQLPLLAFARTEFSPEVTEARTTCKAPEASRKGSDRALRLVDSVVGVVEWNHDVAKQVTTQTCCNALKLLSKKLASQGREFFFHKDSKSLLLDGRNTPLNKDCITPF